MIDINEAMLPVRVTLRNGERAIVSAISPCANFYIGFRMSHGVEWFPITWTKRLTSSSELGPHSQDVVFAGWGPNPASVDWSQLPAQVKYVTKIAGMNHVYMWENCPVFNLKHKNWELKYFSPSFSGTMPAKWLGLENWEGGHRAILERPVC